MAIIGHNQVHIGVELLDINEVYALIRDLKEIDQHRAVKSGLRRASGVFIVGGKRRLRERMLVGKTGNLKSSFRSRVKKRKAGALAGFEYPIGNHAHLVDRGTVRRYTKKGKHRGIMPANYFWDDTRKQDGAKAIDIMMLGIEQACERIRQRNG